MNNTATGAILRLDKGATVFCAGREYVIVEIPDINLILARDVLSGQRVVLKVGDLGPATSSSGEDEAPPQSRDLLDVSAEDWAVAEQRRKVIEPLLRRRERGGDLVGKAAAEAYVTVNTIYRWLETYRNTGLLSSLLPTKRSGGRGKGRLSKEVEAIVEDQIQNYYLTDQRNSMADTAEEVRRLCLIAKLDPPHPLTVRQRILWLPERERVARRYSKRLASQMFDPNEGSVPEAGWPLAMVQVDHTLLPVMIVHEVTRQCIGRPWVTFAIDVFSRVVLGMYLSLDAPSAMSAGLCVSRAILPKEKWLADLGVEVEWPCWGVMGILHMDNAREFRGDMLKIACSEYSIDLVLRPVKKPHYGAHIERLMGTVSQRLKRISGTTFSGVEEKGEYDSEAKANMSFGELERWLTYFVGWYHHQLHSGIGMKPLEKYRRGLLGGDGRPPRGLPARRLDEEKIRLDFMPFEERTIQDYGVLWDLHYFADVLRPWINSRDPDNPKLKRLFRFRRDPRDISQLYFFDPDTRRYYTIPYRNASLPPASIWELREARKIVRQEGIKNIDEDTLFRIIEQQRRIEDEAAAKTKSARRSQQRRMQHEKARKHKAKELPTVSETAAVPSMALPKFEGYDLSKIKPLDEK